MPHNLLSENPKAEYATAWRTNVEEVRDAARLPSCWKVLVLLWIVTFILQAIAASLRAYVNPDGVTYLCITDYLVEGNLEKGLSNFGANTFITMLVLFKHFGLDPFHAGVWWNAIVSSLVILPLFGWVRRMFDRRIAVIVSLLYAFHPIVLSIGSAVMRDPMFWLFFHLTLYGTWRGVTEVRLRWFLVAGCGLTLAIHTRSEAWFLLIPILLWVLGRFWFASGYRIRLCFGTLVLLAMVPGSITAMNLTVLKSCPQWGIFRPSHSKQLLAIYDKVKEKLHGSEAISQKEVKPSAPQKTTPKKTASKKPPQKAKPKPEPPPSFVTAGLRRAILRIAKSYSYLYGIYFLIGVGVWRAWRYFAINAMSLMLIPIFALVWYKSCDADVSPRYFLPIVFTSLPVIAIGILWIAQKIASFPKKQSDKRPSLRKSLCWLIAIMVFTFTISGFGTIWGTNLSEQKECELGKWVLTRFGPDQRLCCINRKPRMAAWYAKTKWKMRKSYPVCGPNKMIVPQKQLTAIFKKAKPLVVLCWENHRTPPGMTGLFETLKKNHYYGYQVVEPDVLTEYKPKVLVLVRKDAL